MKIVVRNAYLIVITHMFASSKDRSPSLFGCLELTIVTYNDYILSTDALLSMVVS